MYDIIIVGGGPAGSTAGKYLAQFGKRALLLQKDFSFKKPCGGGLRMDAFTEFSLDSSLIKNRVTNIVLETEKRVINFDISATPLAVVERVEFDKALRQEARDVGVEVVEEKVLNVEVFSSYVQVKTKEHIYKANYLIASDGVFSTVRRLLRGEDVPKGLTHYSDIAGLKIDKCHFYFGTKLSNKAYAWRFPYGDGADIGTFAPKNSKNFIFNLFKFLEVPKMEKIKGYNIPEWKNPIFYDNRVFYVGDSAGQVLPFTYEGIYYAMKSAKILAEVIGEGADSLEYEKRWKRLYLKKFRTLKYLQKFFLKNDFMIFVMMKTLEKPSVKRKVIELWMDKYEIKIDTGFFLRTLKRLFTN